MENFCLAYKYILSKHHLYATGITGRRIEEVTNLKVYKFLPGSVGGDKQFYGYDRAELYGYGHFLLQSVGDQPEYGRYPVDLPVL